jgi:hypothetical protein
MLSQNSFKEKSARIQKRPYVRTQIVIRASREASALFIWRTGLLFRDGINGRKNADDFGFVEVLVRIKCTWERLFHQIGSCNDGGIAERDWSIELISNARKPIPKADAPGPALIEVTK